MNLNLKKPWRSGSHKDPNNRLLTDRGSKYSVILDADSEGKNRVVKRTSAGDVLFENGMATVPDDSRGLDIVADLTKEAKWPGQYNFHQHHEGRSMKRDHQVMWRAIWNPQCKVEGCTNEAVVQRLCHEHWGKRWQVGA